MKVIVIDDDPIALDVAEASLHDMGHDVIRRSSAIGASAWVLRERPDFVLVDLEMPALPGEEWLDLVAQDGLVSADGYEPSFIVFSGKSVEELERVVQSTCAIGYIQKQQGADDFAIQFEKLTRGQPA